MSFTELDSYIAGRIAATPTQPEPYPHIFVENVFPDDVYDAMRDAMPSLVEFRPLWHFGTVAKDMYSNRHCFPLEPDWIERNLGVQRASVWSRIREAIDGPAVRMAFADHFMPQINERFDGDPPLGDGQTKLRLRLMSDRASYKIGPHTDAISRIVTALFYLPEDDAYADMLGTRVYVPKDSAKDYKHGVHNSFDEFDEVGHVQFAPNTMVGFVNVDNAFHGVPPMDVPDDYRRELLLYDLNQIPTARA